MNQRRIALILLLFFAVAGCDSGSTDIQIFIDARVTVVTMGIRVEDSSFTDPPDRIRTVNFELFDSTDLFIDSALVPPAGVGQPNSHTFRTLKAGLYTVKQTVIATDDTFATREYERMVQ